MSRTSKTFKITTILLSIIDILAIVYFAISLSLAINQKTILNTAHLVLLIITIIINTVYCGYLITYLIIHKKK